MDRVVIEQQRRQDGFLGFQVVGRNRMARDNREVVVGSMLILRLLGIRHGTPSVGDRGNALYSNCELFGAEATRCVSFPR
jgi:hypothetical protein